MAAMTSIMHVPKLALSGNVLRKMVGGGGRMASSLPGLYNMDKVVGDRYARIPLSGTKTIAEYIWIDGTLENVRSKTRILSRTPNSVEDLPMWTYDGSSCYQASGDNSDILLKPVAMYADPFRLGNHKLVLCETLTADLKPHKTNTRRSCAEIMKEVHADKPWFGMEQEYTMLDMDGHPLGWPKMGYPAPQGPYYCGVGATKVVARDIVEAHFSACLHAGLDISGINAEVMPGQWEYQVGPSLGINMGDHLWMSRFILHRVAEDFGVQITLDPKPMPGEWNGAGCHVNISTEDTRRTGGLKVIKEMCELLGKHHQDHMVRYDVTGGKDNLRRLTGRHETSSPDVFTWAVSDRGASIRIPAQVNLDGCGHLEDRRPSSNCEPYMVTECCMRSIYKMWPDDKKE